MGNDPMSNGLLKPSQSRRSSFSSTTSVSASEVAGPSASAPKRQPGARPAYAPSVSDPF